MLKYKLDNDIVTIIIRGKMFSHQANSRLGKELAKRCLEDVKDEQAIWDLLNPAAQVKVFTQGRVTLKGNELFFDGTKMEDEFARRFNECLDKGYAFAPLAKCITKLRGNPSKKVRDNLLRFMAYTGIAIDQDGDIVGFKAVTHNFYSITPGKIKLLQSHADESGHVFNGIGQTVQCDRGDVEDDPDQGCASGLHLGTRDYATSFGGCNANIVLVKCSPSDVVSVPFDCECQKIRACLYHVLSLERGPLAGIIDSTAPYAEAPSDEVEEEDDADVSVRVRPGIKVRIGHKVTQADQDEADDLDELEELRERLNEVAARIASRRS